MLPAGHCKRSRLQISAPCLCNMHQAACSSRSMVTSCATSRPSKKHEEVDSLQGVTGQSRSPEHAVIPGGNAEVEEDGQTEALLKELRTAAALEVRHSTRSGGQGQELTGPRRMPRGIIPLTPCNCSCIGFAAFSVGRLLLRRPPAETLSRYRGSSVPDCQAAMVKTVGSLPSRSLLDFCTTALRTLA